MRGSFVKILTVFIIVHIILLLINQPTHPHHAHHTLNINLACKWKRHHTPERDSNLKADSLFLL